MKYKEVNFDEIFEGVNSFAKYESNFRASLIARYEVNKKFTNVFTIFICSIIEKLFSKNKSIKYYFYGLKYKELILSLPREEVCIIGGPRQIIFCFINSISFVSIIDIWPFLTSGLTLGCWGPENQERIDRKVFYLRRKLLATYNAAAYLIMINDTMPMERMLINSIKLSKIKSIVIQHGIFSAGAHKAAADGFYSDYIFCISNLQKGIIESKGISSSKVIEMGFGHSVYKTKRTGISNPKKICFLGQQWAQVDSLLFEKYITIVCDLRDIANSLGVDFVYKPHPAENNFNFIDEKYSDRCTLEQAIDNYDFFFSINSTALLEVSRSGLVAVQLFDELFGIDLLDTEGHVKVLKISELSKVGLQDEILKIIVRGVKIDGAKETPLMERFFASITAISNK